MLKKKFGPLKPGTIVYCFGEQEKVYWLELPCDWAGSNQINVDKKLFLELI